MDQTLLKYWKTCLQDAERKAIAPKGARITLNIGDKILKFVPLKSIPVISLIGKQKIAMKTKVMIAPCILCPNLKTAGLPNQKDRNIPFDYCHHVA